MLRCIIACEYSSHLCALLPGDQQIRPACHWRVLSGGRQGAVLTRVCRDVRISYMFYV